MTTFHPLRASALTGQHASLDGRPAVEQDPGATAAALPRPGVLPLPDATGRTHSGPPSAAPWEDTGAETFTCATCADRGTVRGRPCIDCSSDA